MGRMEAHGIRSVALVRMASLGRRTVRWSDSMFYGYLTVILYG